MAILQMHSRDICHDLIEYSTYFTDTDVHVGQQPIFGCAAVQETSYGTEE